MKTAIRRRDKTAPWEHLRKNRHPANTYLNKLSRTDYRELFSRHFRILDEKTMKPDYGRQYLSDDIRNELTSYSDDELFSNSVRFVLEPLS